MSFAFMVYVLGPICSSFQSICDSLNLLVVPWLHAEVGRRQASGGEQQEDAACRQGVARGAGRPQRTAPLAGARTLVHEESCACSCGRV